MQILIRTKYIPATNNTGSRIKATFGGKTKSIPYPYELSGEAVHKKAALAWVEKHMTRQGWDDPSRFALKTHWSEKRGYSFEVKAKQN
jgi:hypothetical protein